VTNPQAMRTIDLQPSNDRYDFEHIFRNYPNVNIIGILDDNIDGSNLNVMFTKLHNTNTLEKQKLLSLI